MAYTSPWSQQWPQWYLKGLLFCVLAAWTQATTLSYCSPSNNGGSNHLNSIYMSNGMCDDNCKGSYVFAIVQGQDCWCSNYIPADQTGTSLCSDPCPGYPTDTCGNSAQGLYGYINLGGTASGTADGSSSSVSASASASASASSTSSASSSPSPSSSSRTTSTTPSSTTSSSSIITNEPSQVYTSVITVTGRVSTILVTSAPAQTSDSALGASSQPSGGGGGISGGTVAGIVVGVAIAIGLVIGSIVFVLLRRRHKKDLDAASEGASFTSPSQASKTKGGIPSRQVSQMSSAGLLTKPTRINTGVPSTGDDNRSAGLGTQASDRNSSHMTVDQRLNPWAIYSNEASRISNVSLQDNHDYSRQLRVANPDP